MKKFRIKIKNEVHEVTLKDIPIGEIRYMKTYIKDIIITEKLSNNDKIELVSNNNSVLLLINEHYHLHFRMITANELS